MVPVITLILLSFALAWAVFLKAGVEPTDWVVSLLIIGFVSQIYFWFTRRIHRAPPLPLWVRLVIWALPAYLVCQLIPLPLPILHFLSPARANLAAALTPIIPGIRSAPLAENPTAATLGLFTILGYTATFLLIRELAWRWADRPWVPAIPLIAIAAIESLIGLVQVFTGSEMAMGTYQSHDHFPGLLEMVLPFALLWGLAILRRNIRRLDSPALPAAAVCGMWAIVALLLLAIIYSLSRGGLLVAVCTLAFLGFMIFRKVARPLAHVCVFVS